MTPNIRIIDFSAGSWRNFFLSPNSTAFAAPELLIEKIKASGHADIWALGCTIYEARSGEMPFRLNYQNEGVEVLRILHTLGKLPNDWAQIPFRAYGLPGYGDPAGKPWVGFNRLVEYPLMKMILDIQGECINDPRGPRIS